ncbi:uncharacterized protein Z519_06591 [Cladophialophora bantiana CBS 173.52]|uniref:Major facilitator superfamily (MFS) profile domain-containing protein n=1 Tax=Cladophialophora bantiana (strain ATCC 10958 / CBS 173.52 / CDC B-1940 / NIH 8579) TaxID=1442370 RepID=A0A0D2HHJ8_CLAB1|nr:uncharacterized protein Z519_06591 [Cladophialophora bantiana CBS 173.52]KIW92743.1 hypothetical protein Z519_06591 [Cladophialophora bantiana CBS 173.52]
MATSDDKPHEIVQEERMPSPTPQETGLEKVISVDTVHNDEAIKVITRYTGPQTWEPEEEKKLRRKLDRRLLPILCVTYALQYYDKAMISVAAIFGLREDLQLTGNRYSMAAAIFFLGFLGGAYPASQLAQRYPIERVAGCLVFTWGVCFALTPACQNWQGLYAQRFFLGFLEAGVSPIFMLIIGQFYKKDEQALMMGVWYSASSFISFVGFPINWGLGHIKGSLSPWRYMYIVGGILTTLWAFVILFFMPPDPIRAKGLTERQRYIALARLRINNAGVRNLHFKKQQLFELLRDEKFWLIFAMGYLSMISAGVVNAFLPIVVVVGFKLDVFKALLILSPGGVVVGVAILASTYTAYKVPKSRCYIIFGSQLVTVVSACLLWKLPLSALGGLLFCCYIFPGFTCGWGVIMGLSIANTAGYTKRVVSSSGIYLGYCLGQFTGPLLFKDQDAPRYVPGFQAVVATAAAAAVLSLIYRFVCVWDNRRRDKAGIAEAFEHAYEDDLTDKKV